MFNVNNVSEIKQVYSSAWSINDTYILKRNTNASELEKSVSLSNMLVSDNIPVPKYFQTINKDSYVYFDGEYNYCLMSKFSGHHIDPFLGDCAQIGKKLGKIVANLHKSLKQIGKQI